MLFNLQFYHSYEIIYLLYSDEIKSYKQLTIIFNNISMQIIKNYLTLCQFISPKENSVRAGNVSLYIARQIA